LKVTRVALPGRPARGHSRASAARKALARPNGARATPLAGERGKRRSAIQRQATPSTNTTTAA
jgi:hypothetical protein